MNDKISQDTINKALWAACDTFRGTISADTYKDFILTMLFLKYISDVWQVGTMEHFLEAFRDADVDGALAASVFHKQIINIGELKAYLAAQGVEIRVC